MIIEALSDISRTNQIKITSSPEKVAEKLFLYLFKLEKGIGWFDAKDLDFNKEKDSRSDFYQRRHKAIKQEIKKRLLGHGKEPKDGDIQYFMSYSNGKIPVFFLTPDKTNSSWKEQFKDQTNQGKILNLVFKIHLLSKSLSSFSETMNGFEKLLFVHSTKLTKSENGLVVWGQEISLNYNYHHVLTVKLSRTCLLFSEKSQYHTFDGDDMGEMSIYNDKEYYFTKKLDGRSANFIQFMTFKKDKSFENFKKSQICHYQNLATQLENFLNMCGIAYERLSFQADHYIKDCFIKDKDVKTVKNLEIINNTGKDLTENDKRFLDNILQQQGVFSLSFYLSGKSISSYEFIEDEGIPCWKINEMASWKEIVLDKQKNYLVFNKILDEESETSIAYQHDGLWYSTTQVKDVDDQPIVDFYTQLKRKTCYVDTGEFFSIQGMNVQELRMIKNKKETVRSILDYLKNNIDLDELHQEAKEFTNGKLLESEEAIIYYLMNQHNIPASKKFRKKYKIKFSPEFQKVLIELGIKNWIRENFEKPGLAFRIHYPSLPEQEFFSIYVRHPKDQTEKVVAVEFLYKDGNLSIKNVLRDVSEIKKRFSKILKTKKNNSDDLINNRYYLVDEKQGISISCYTDDLYTPTLIGCEALIEKVENGDLQMNRQRNNKLFPLVLYYNDQVQQVKDLICLDLRNKTFIQYYVPPAKSLGRELKKAEGFRVYHIIGKTFSGADLTTEELIKLPITLLHFSTLTQKILKLGDNSQSSLLQKVAKVFIEN